MEGSLVFVFGIKGYLGNTRAMPLQLFRIKAPFQGNCHQGAVHRVTNDFSSSQFGVVAKYNRFQQGFQVRQAGVAACDFACSIVTLTADLEVLAAGVKVSGGHLVDSQCTGFVGADDRGATEGFHGSKALDNGLVAGHALQADGKGDSYHCGQTFRDCSDGQCYRGHDHGHPGLTPQQARDQHEYHYDTGDHRKPLTQVIQLYLQWSR